MAKKKLKLSQSITFDTLYGVSWSHDGTQDRLRLRRQHACGPSTPRPASRSSTRAPTTTGCWAPSSPRTRRYLVSVSRDRSMKLTEVATQRFIDNITSITPGALKGGLLAVARNPVKGHRRSRARRRHRQVGEVLRRAADRRLRRRAAAVQDAPRPRKRVIGDDANKIREFPPMPGRIFALAFNQDGSLFAAGSSLDGTGEVRVYQTADGKLVSKLEGQHGPVYAVAFRPDGKQVASAGFDGIVRLNDPRDRQADQGIRPRAADGQRCGPA